MVKGFLGQWLYINPARSVVITKHANQPQPVDEPLDLNTLNLFHQIAAALSESG